MRIAFVHNFHRSAVPSGEDTVVHAERDALARAGHDVEVFGVSNDDVEGGAVSQLRAAVTASSGRFGLMPVDDLAAFAPDVIHVHNLFPHLGTSWLGRLETPIVATLHNFRPICANGYFFRDGAVCTRCADGKPWSGVLYGCYRDSRLATVPLTVRSVIGARRDPLLRRASAIVVPSARTLEQFARVGVPRDKLRVGVHFVPDDVVAPSESVDGTAPPANGRDPVWVFVGRLTPEKGIDRLVAEWPADIELRIIGSGELHDDIAVAARGKRVTLVGNVPRADVAKEMSAACGVVVPSVWFETASLVYLESVAVGTPVLAFEPNIVAEFVTRDGTGAVARWDSVAADVEQAGQSFPALREKCRAVYLQQHSEARFVADRIELYERVSS